MCRYDDFAGLYFAIHQRALASAVVLWQTEPARGQQSEVTSLLIYAEEMRPNKLSGEDELKLRAKIADKAQIVRLKQLEAVATASRDDNLLHLLLEEGTSLGQHVERVIEVGRKAAGCKTTQIKEYDFLSMFRAKVDEYNETMCRVYRAKGENDALVAEWLHMRQLFNERKVLRKLRNLAPGLTRAIRRQYTLDDLWLRLTFDLGEMQRRPVPTWNAGVGGSFLAGKAEGCIEPPQPGEILGWARHAIEQDNWLPDLLLSQVAESDRCRFRANLRSRLNKTPQAFVKWLVAAGVYYPRSRRR